MYQKEVPICQIHGDELRQEHLVDEEGRGYMSGFCFKCAKHYRLCSACRYMDHCIKRVDHAGDHIDGGSHTWNDSFYDRYR